MIWLLILFVVLQLADAVTTYLALKGRGIAEGSPIAKWLLDKLGLVPAILLGKVAALGLGYILYLGNAWWAFVPLIAWYGFGIFNNVRLLRNRAATQGE